VAPQRQVEQPPVERQRVAPQQVAPLALR
jgi:hypothetical protein